MNEDLGSLYGNGKYALVVKPKRDPGYNSYLYRIEPVQNKTAKHMVDLQNNVHRRLTLAQLGPSVANLYKDKWYAFSELPKETQNDCMLYLQLSQKKTRKMCVNVTRVERGDEKLSKVLFQNQDVAKFAEFSFMLFWTLWTTNAEFGFRHRDIKLGNIVVKTLRKDQLLVFSVDKGKTLQLSMQVSEIPLLIDFGFSSLEESPESIRHNIGTTALCPPEFLAFRLLFEDTMTSMNTNRLLCEDTYDIWSMAMTLVSSRLGKFSILDLAGNPVGLHLDDLIGKDGLVFDFSSYREAYLLNYKILFRICFFQKAIGNEIFPNKQLLGAQYSRYLFTDGLRKRLESFDSIYDISGKYKKRWERLAFPPKLETLFRRLFDWDGEMRCYDGEFVNVLKILASYCDNNPKSDAPVTRHFAQAENKRLLDFQ